MRSVKQLASTTDDECTTFWTVELGALSPSNAPASCTTPTSACYNAAQNCLVAAVRRPAAAFLPRWRSLTKCSCPASSSTQSATLASPHLKKGRQQTCSSVCKPQTSRAISMPLTHPSNISVEHPAPIAGETEPSCSRPSRVAMYSESSRSCEKPETYSE